MNNGKDKVEMWNVECADINFSVDRGCETMEEGKKWCGNCKWGQRVCEPEPGEKAAYVCHAPMNATVAPKKSVECPDDPTGYPGWESRV